MTGVLEAFRSTGRSRSSPARDAASVPQIARTFAEAGADIVLAARTKEQLDAVAEDVRGLGRRALVIPSDVNDNDVVAGLVAQAVEEFGRLDIVVNNAGGTMPRPFLDTSPGFLERSFHFNVTTAFVLSKAARTPAHAPRAAAAERRARSSNISSAIGRLRDRGFRRVRHGQGCAQPHDAAHGRRSRAESAGQRHRGRLDRDVCARDRAGGRGDSRRNGAAHTVEAPGRTGGHRVVRALPRVARRRAS